MSEPATSVVFARARVVRARVGAWLIDTAAPAYAAWCVATLAQPEGSESFLARHPLLLVASPLLALLWQASGRSLGQRAYGLRLVRADGSGADLDDRAAVSLLGLVRLAVLVGPFFLLPAPLAFLLALALVVVEGVLALADPSARSVPERALGLRTAQGSVDPAEGRPWALRPESGAVVALLLLTFAVGFRVTGFSFAAVLEGAGRTGSLWRGIFQPDGSIVVDVLEALVETVFLALMASVLALPFAFVLGFLGAGNLMGGSALGVTVYVVVRALLTVVRSIEPLFWGIVFTIWVGIGPFAGMLALLVHSAASLGKLYSEAIESVDPGPLEAVRSTGADPLQVARYGVLPQVIPAFLSFTVYRWDINVRMATILGLIGGGGIGAMVVNVMQFGAWAKFGTIAWLVALVVFLLDLTSARARRRVV